MKETPGPFGLTARLYVLGIVAAGVGVVVYSLADLAAHRVAPEWLILVALTVASGWATLSVPGMPISFSISDTFTIAASLLFGPAAGALTAALDGLVVTSRIPKTQRTWDRILFNMAAPTIAVWVAATVFFTLGGNRPPFESPLAALRLIVLLTIFGTIVFGLNSGIVAAAVSFERRRSIVTIWREHLAGVWITYFAGIFGAMLLMLLTRFSTLDILILILPLPVILYVTYRHAIGRAADQIDHLAKVNRVFVGAIEALAHAVDAKDEVTHDHTRRVQDQAAHLARALGVDDEGDTQAIKAASLLHDVGKLAVPEHILNKPGRLTPAEYDIMKRHAAIGADILSMIGLPFAVAPIVRHHHENWDGTGYPDGLAGDRIPVGSRILAVVDCFDALTSDRPYRPRMDDRQALDILRDRRGAMYDPRVVDAFLALHGHRTSAASVPLSSHPHPSGRQTPPRAAEDRHDETGMQMLFDLGLALGSSGAIADIGEMVWTQFRKHLPVVSSFVLYQYDRADDSIVARYRAGDEASLLTARMRLGERLSGWVAATGEIVANSDARLDLDEALRNQSQLRSALAVPVSAGGQAAAGVFSLYARSPNAFDDTHRQIVQAVACAVSRHAGQVEPFKVR